MRVQSIGQNNYNYQTNQNAKNNPTFTHYNNIACIVQSRTNLPEKFPEHLRTAFLQMMAHMGQITDYFHIFQGRPIFIPRSENAGILVLINRMSEAAVKRLAKLPSDFEAKCFTKYHPELDRFCKGVMNDSGIILEVKMEALEKAAKAVPDRNGLITLIPFSVPIHQTKPAL